MKSNNFDLLRLFAAFQVILGHTTSHLLSQKGYQIEGWFDVFQKIFSYVPGVPIFFLISGFLIAMSYDRNPNIKTYIKNRLLRIYPALYVNIIVGICILFYFDFITFNLEFFSWLIAQMSIIQFYNAEMFRGFGVGVINGSLWTISIELTFYIILPVFVLFYKKSRCLIGILFLASFLLWNYDLASNKDIFYNKLLHVTIVPYLFIFILGIGFYKFYGVFEKYIENKFLFWIFVYVIFNVSIHYLDIKMNFFMHIVKWIIFSFFIFSFAFTYKNVSKVLLLGNDYTYGVYIYHMLVINVFIELKLVGEIKYLLTAILISLILGIMSWHWIEKPFLKLKKHSLFNEMH